MLNMLFLECVLPPPEPPESALVLLATSSYGFYPVDTGLTQDDLEELDALSICVNKDYNHFGSFAGIEVEIASYLSSIGPNERLLVEHIAKRIHKIVCEVMAASGKEAAWIALRASTPHSKFDRPRWHMDGCYYAPEKGEIQYKFVMALIGPSTLFYPLPRAQPETRSEFWKYMPNPLIKSKICLPENTIDPGTRQGMFFMGGDKYKAGVHSEPPVHKNRLFFSIVPCRKDQIGMIKEKVLSDYKRGGYGPPPL